MDNVIVAANLGAALLEQTGSRGNLITKAHVQLGKGEFCAAPAASAASTGTALVHAGNFVDATLLVVGSPLADLLAIFEMTGTHLRGVFLNHSQYPSGCPLTTVPLAKILPSL